MYHVPATGIIIILLYFISFYFSKTGFYSLQLHWKIWNSILALAFIVAALAGLFLALQISYKWDVPYIKEILKWHVETGAGMAITGMIHFIWHLPYFFRKANGGDKTADMSSATREEEWKGHNTAGVNLFVTGFVSSAFQLLLIRELLNISGGYELITGVFLGIWLLLSSAGSYIAGRSEVSDFGKVNLVFSISPVLSLILMFILSDLMLITGETPSVLKSIVFIMIVLLPFCIASGFIFIRLTTHAKKFRKSSPGRSFAIETTGGIAAGVFLSLIMAGKLGTYKLMVIIILLYSAYVLLNFFIRSASLKTVIKILYVLIISFVIAGEPDVLFRQFMMHGIRIVETRDTPYGNITTGKYEGEESIYYNQRLLLYNEDVIEREENIHYAMLQHDSPGKVMLISGSLQSHLKEIFKYPVGNLTYVERDPVLARTDIADSLKNKVTISNTDAYSFLKKSDWKGDIIIMLLPPPSTLLLNRYYTLEFFSEVSRKLNNDGVFVCCTGLWDGYLNEESVRMNSSIYNTLKSVFPHVSVVPGNKIYMVASTKNLSLGYSSLAAQKKIENVYVSQDYLSDDLIKRKSEEIVKILNKDTRPNKNSFPLAYSYFQWYHLSKSPGEKIPVIIILTALFALPLAGIRRKNAVMYASASALAGFEIIALLTLQATAGNMYQMTGLVLAGLMTGLASGASMDFKWLRKIKIRYRAAVLALFYFIASIAYPMLLDIVNTMLSTVMIIAVTFLPAMATGNIYRELTADCDDSGGTSLVYSSDLAGSALGFLLVSVFAIPVFGTVLTIFMLGMVVIAGFLIGIVTDKSKF